MGEAGADDLISTFKFKAVITWSNSASTLEAVIGTAAAASVTKSYSLLCSVDILYSLI
jgi:hypothetical protein